MSVSIELANAFAALTNSYKRQENAVGLSELAELKAFLEGKLKEYDPVTAERLNEDFFSDSN